MNAAGDEVSIIGNGGLLNASHDPMLFLLLHENMHYQKIAVLKHLVKHTIEKI
jgi:hypothetical protein